MPVEENFEHGREHGSCSELNFSRSTPRADSWTSLLLASANLYQTIQATLTDALSEEISTLCADDIDIQRLEELSAPKDNGTQSIKSRRTLENELLKPLSTDLMLILWRESDFASDAAVQAAGMMKTTDAITPITKSYIVKQVSTSKGIVDFDENKRLETQVARAFQALEIFGFCEKIPELERPNFKPVRATKRLDNVMEAVYSAVSEKIAEAVYRKDS